MMKPIRGFFGLFLLSFCWGCAPKRADVIGKYIHEGVSDNASIEVKADGTYAKYSGANMIDHGKWRVVRHPYFDDSGIELSAGANTNEYRLTQWHGAPCWEVQSGADYWCKAGK